ncbi:MAG: hypothetical protein HWE30_16075 [Methylocystaceae bacterium]|nr:hypothetical protein [Methylocystaceae bacterium]
MLKGLVIVGLLMTLQACQTTQMEYHNINQEAVYSVHEVERLSRQISYNPRDGQPINMRQYKFFTDNTLAQEWLIKQRHKAIAIGYPEQCSRYYSTWQSATPVKAVRKVLLKCLSYMRTFSKHIGRTCGCKIAAVNDRVFFTPQELPFRRRLPAVALVNDHRGRQEINGYVDIVGRTGSEQPLRFLTAQGKEVCTGTYTLQSNSKQGRAYLDCFDGRIKGPAAFEIAGILESQAYGTALLNAGKDKLIMVYGLTREEFEKRRTQLLGGKE